MPYDIKEHTHRFATWAASRAANPRGRRRFNEVAGRGWIEQVGELRHCVCAPENLPEPENFCKKHRQWRNELIQASDGVITDGIAAKLINVYLKASVVQCCFADQPKVKVVHPPIDNFLLKSLKLTRNDIWRGQSVTWSELDSDQYEAVIEKVCKTLGDGVALWKIEEHWQGHQ